MFKYDTADTFKRARITITVGFHIGVENGVAISLGHEGSKITFWLLLN